VGYWIQRTAGDEELRVRLKKLGASWHSECIVTAWHDDGATVRSLLDGSETPIDADALVLATTNVAETWLADELADSGLEIHTAGACIAPRLAVMAIYEGRVVGMKL
jgi:hypothetical protein